MKSKSIGTPKYAGRSKSTHKVERFEKASIRSQEKIPRSPTPLGRSKGQKKAAAELSAYRPLAKSTQDLPPEPTLASPEGAPNPLQNELDAIQANNQFHLADFDGAIAVRKQCHQHYFRLFDYNPSVTEVVRFGKPTIAAPFNLQKTAPNSHVEGLRKHALVKDKDPGADIRRMGAMINWFVEALTPVAKDTTTHQIVGNPAFTFTPEEEAKRQEETDRARDRKNAAAADYALLKAPILMPGEEALKGIMESALPMLSSMADLKNRLNANDTAAVQQLQAFYGFAQYPLTALNIVPTQMVAHLTLLHKSLQEELGKQQPSPATLKAIAGEIKSKIHLTLNVLVSVGTVLTNDEVVLQQHKGGFLKEKGPVFSREAQDALHLLGVHMLDHAASLMHVDGPLMVFLEMAEDLTKADGAPTPELVELMKPAPTQTIAIPVDIAPPSDVLQEQVSVPDLPLYVENGSRNEAGDIVVSNDNWDYRARAEPSSLPVSPMSPPRRELARRANIKGTERPDFPGTKV